MTPCAYCGARAVQTDHLISKACARRLGAAAAARERPEYKVPACRECNEQKGPRLRVPASLAHLIPELEALTLSKYGVFDGTAEALRGTIK